MNWLSDDHVGQPTFARSLHYRPSLRLKVEDFMPPVGPASNPAMKRPLGDHRGDHTPSDPGSVVIWWLARSRTRKR